MTLLITESGGITSTYVENTTWSRNGLNDVRDHLHIRGEHQSQFIQSCYRLGSPPHTWRTHNLVIDASNAGGITSTYVENTYRGTFVPECAQDHLHIRGEHLKILTKKI